MDIKHYDSIAEYEREIATEYNPRPLRDAAELVTGKPCDLEGWPCTVVTIQGVNKEGYLDGLLTHTIIIPDERGTCGWDKSNDGWHSTEGDPRDGLTSFGGVVDLVHAADKSADAQELAKSAMEIWKVLGGSENDTRVFFVASDDGTVAAHDCDIATALSALDIEREKDPSAGWQVMWEGGAE